MPSELCPLLYHRFPLSGSCPPSNEPCPPLKRSIEPSRRRNVPWVPEDRHRLILPLLPLLPSSRLPRSIRLRPKLWLRFLQRCHRRRLTTNDNRVLSPSPSPVDRPNKPLSALLPPSLQPRQRSMARPMSRAESSRQNPAVLSDVSRMIGNELVRRFLRLRHRLLLILSLIHIITRLPW